MGFYPFVKTGTPDWYDAATAGGADPTGVNYSDAGFAAMVANYQATGQAGYIRAGKYKIQSTMNWKVAGLVVNTDGTQNVTITMETANTPILQLAGQGQFIGGLTLAYAAQQTSAQTSAIAVEFGDDTVGSCFMSTFEAFSILLCNTALAINPAVSVVAGLFSCYFGNLYILGYSYRAINLIGGNDVGAGCTGCVFDNTYIHNNYSGTDANSTSWPVFFQVWSEVVFNQLNIEHALLQDSDACVFAHCGNVVINGLHLEHLEVSGTPGFGLVGVGTSTGTIQVNGLSVEFCTLTGTARDGVFRVTGGSGQNIILNGLYFPAANAGGSTTPATPLVDFNSATNVTAQITGLDATETGVWTEPYAAAGSGCTVSGVTGTAVLAAGTAAVAFAPLAAGAQISLATETPGGTPGAVYVSAVTPGTGFTITSTSVLDTSTIAYTVT